MTQYLLSFYEPGGGPPPAEFMESVARDLHALSQDLKAAGAWVFSRGLHAPSTATVVRLRDGDVVTTDGPYVESKEHIGGVWILDAPGPHARPRLAPPAAPPAPPPVQGGPVPALPPSCTPFGPPHAS